MIGTNWTDITEGDYWTDSTGWGLAYWRVLGKVTQNTSNRTARVDFKWQVSYEYEGYTAYNNDSHSYSITCTDNNGGGHSATSNWAFGTFGYNWEDRGVGGDDYWANIPYRADGTASFNATFSGARWNNNSFSWTTNVQLATIASAYTVSYNANGGTNAPNAQTKTHNVTLTLSSQKPTRTGYTFVKWNTAQDGSGTGYSSGGSYTANASVTLYAQWSINSYAVTINPNGGSFTSSKNSTAQTTAQTYTVNHGTSITSINGTRSGYICSGWYDAASGGNKILNNNGNLSNIGQAYTLYAQWTKETPPPDPIYDIYAKIEGSWVPGALWIKVGDNWYRVLETELKVGDSWRRTKAT